MRSGGVGCVWSCVDKEEEDCTSRRWTSAGSCVNREEEACM